MLSAHQFAVLKFDRVGVARFRDGDHFRALGELVENRMNGRRTEISHVGHLIPVAGQRVRHDRAVAAEFHHLGDELKVGAQAGRGSHLPGKFRHRGHASVVGGGLALGDNVDNGIHESVEPDEHLGLGKPVASG